eukprot:3934526-Rhodomonas_salina.3
MELSPAASAEAPSSGSMPALVLLLVAAVAALRRAPATRNVSLAATEINFKRRETLFTQPDTDLQHDNRQQQRPRRPGARALASRAAPAEPAPPGPAAPLAPPRQKPRPPASLSRSRRFDLSSWARSAACWPRGQHWASRTEDLDSQCLQEYHAMQACPEARPTRPPQRSATRGATARASS